MLHRPLRFVRVNARGRFVMASLAVAAVLLLGGAWAVAQGNSAHGLSGRSVALTALRPSTNSSAASAQRAGVLRSATSQLGSNKPAASQAASAGAALNIPGLIRLGSASLSPLNANSSGSGRSATGGGATTVFSFGFTAQSHQNGSNSGAVSGNAQFSFHSTNRMVHIRLDCLQVVGNDAFMSGISTEAISNIPAGTEFLFGVQDDDTASKPDLISDLFYSPSTPPATCMTYHAAPHYSVQGNIEIH